MLKPKYTFAIWTIITTIGATPPAHAIINVCYPKLEAWTQYNLSTSGYILSVKDTSDTNATLKLTSALSNQSGTVGQWYSTITRSATPSDNIYCYARIVWPVLSKWFLMTNGAPNTGDKAEWCNNYIQNNSGALGQGLVALPHTWYNNLISLSY